MAGILEGITVVDLSRLIAGPYSTMALADLGARVIKVEALAGEDGRHLGPPFYGESSVTFMSCNRGKESLALDLRKPAGRDILDRLIRSSQVVVHNFRPDFAEKYALTYDDRVAHRPEMAAELGPIFATHPATHWLSAFDDADIPCGPVNTVSQAMADPHLAARFVAHPALPGLPLIPFPAHLVRGMLSPEQMAPPPRAGQHSAALLHELGCDAAEVQRLVRERVVRLADPAP